MEKFPRILFKYCDAGALDILESGLLRIKSASGFNDPFEIRPGFDEERKNRYVEGHETFYRRALGVQHSLAEGQSLGDIPVENIGDFDTPLHHELRRYLDSRIRILCLSKKENSVLMWGHYAVMHRGFVIGVNVDAPGFHRGKNSAGFDVSYRADRTEVLFPEEFYDFIKTDIDGRFVTNINQWVMSGSIIISAKERERILEEKVTALLTSKSSDWAYEDEVRFLYDLPASNTSVIRDGSHDAIRLLPEAVQSITVGYFTPFDQVDRLLKLYESGTIGTPTLRYAGFHPYKYEIRSTEADPKTLRAYYRNGRHSI